jgi:hypothetical protein
MTEGDRRTQRRSRVLKSGKLILQHRTIVIDCSVRDLTPAGAHVRMADTHALPSQLELLMPSDRLIYPASVEWQKGAEAGLSFTGPAQRAPLRKW